MTSSDEARSINRTARVAGLLYVGMSIASIFGYMYVPPKFLVPGDAAATATRILANAPLYRFSILADLLGQLLFIGVVLALYQLFARVDKGYARMLVVLVCIAIAGEMVNIANKLTPLTLLSGADYLNTFAKPQLESLAYSFLRWGNNLGQLLTIFWGLWLFPFGILTIKSGFLPKFLGYLLFASGVGYVVTAVCFIAFPDNLDLLTKLMTPLYFGELAIVLWLPIMGARVRQERAVGAVAR